MEHRRHGGSGCGGERAGIPARGVDRGQRGRVGEHVDHCGDLAQVPVAQIQRDHPVRAVEHVLRGGHVRDIPLVQVECGQARRGSARVAEHIGNIRHLGHVPILDTGHTSQHGCAVKHLLHVGRCGGCARARRQADGVEDGQACSLVEHRHHGGDFGCVPAADVERGDP